MPIVEGRPPLSRPLIVEVALRLLDEVGLDELSTRRLALELGVKSPALYWHFANKQSLLDAMGDEIIRRSGMGSSPDDEAWQSWVLRRSHGYRAELLRHRDGARVVSAVRNGSPETFESFLQEVEALSDFGFTSELAIKTITVASHFVTGFVLGEQMRTSAFPIDADAEADIRGPDRPLLTVDPLGEPVFEHGVALIVAGTEQALQDSFRSNASFEIH